MLTRELVPGFGLGFLFLQLFGIPNPGGFLSRAINEIIPPEPREDFRRDISHTKD
jgi:hypothetical protein